MKRLGIIAVGLSALVATPAVSAITPFGSFSPTSQTANIRFINSTNTLCTAVNGGVCGGVGVKFKYLVPMLTSIGEISATYTLLASSTDTVQSAGSTRSEENFLGGFSFISTQAFTVGSHTYAVGTNLLTGIVTFNLGDVSGSVYGKNNGTTANFGASTEDPSTITYTSALLNFSGTVERDFNDSFVSLTPKLTVNANGKFNSFVGTASGLFSSDPPPMVTTSVPEAATWMMMLAGFGTVGAAMRTGRRRKDMFAA